MGVRPTFMGFEAAKTAVFVQQKAIDITGHNLANANTNGYTRQTVDTASIYVAYSSNRIATSRTALAGQGVKALGVGQTRDKFLDKLFREEYSKTAYHAEAADFLSELQNALVDGQDITDNEGGMTGAIQTLYTALQDFTKDPISSAHANIVKSAFTNMTQVLHKLSSNIDNVVKVQTEDLNVTTNRVNEIASQIAYLNKVISQDETVTRDPDNENYRPNELLDQRNLLLDELAGYGEISVTDLPNGMVNVTMGGHELVKEKKFDGLNMFSNDDGTVTVQWASTGEPYTATNGAVRASIDFLNGRGKNVQNSHETSAEGVLYYRDQLDTLAHAIVKIANSSVPEYDPDTKAPKVDADGNIVYKQLLSASTTDANGQVITDNTLPVTADNISISDTWTQTGADYFIYNKGEDVRKYAQSIMDQLVTKDHTFQSYGESFTGTVEEFVQHYVTNLSTEIQFQQGRQDATATSTNDYMEARDQISGVSTDEETANSIVFQKSYQAAARMMTTMDDMLDIVINRMGRVGL